MGAAQPSRVIPVLPETCSALTTEDIAAQVRALGKAFESYAEKAIENGLDGAFLQNEVTAEDLPDIFRQGPLTPPKIRTGVLVQRGYAIWGAELHFRCNRQCNRRFRNETAAIPASEASTSARRRRKIFCGDSDPRAKLTSKIKQPIN